MDARAIFSSKTTFGYASADFDVTDTVVFTTEARADGGLDVSFESGGGAGSCIVDARAIEGAKGMLAISQGTVLALGRAVASGARVTNAVPPLLLPRKVFRAARAGKSPRWTTSTADASTELTLEGQGVLEVQDGASRRSVACVKLTGDDLSLWVADDPQWPWVLRVEQAGGDNYWIALAVGERLDRSQLAALSSGLAEGEPAVAPIEAPKASEANDPVAVVRKMKGAEKKLLAAIDACGARTDLASREALFAALGTDNWKFLNALPVALRRRGAEAGFAEAAAAILERALREAPAFSPPPGETVQVAAIPEAVRVAAMIPRLLSLEHLAHAPLRGLLRTMASDHPSGYLRRVARSSLTSSPLADAEFAAALLASTDDAALAADPDLRHTYVRTLVWLRTPEEVAARVTPLFRSLPIDAARMLFDVVMSSAPEHDARWLAVLRAWKELTHLDRAFAIDAKTMRIDRNVAAKK